MIFSQSSSFYAMTHNRERSLLTALFFRAPPADSAPVLLRLFLADAPPTFSILFPASNIFYPLPLQRKTLQRPKRLPLSLLVDSTVFPSLCVLDDDVLIPSLLTEIRSNLFGENFLGEFKEVSKEVLSKEVGALTDIPRLSHILTWDTELTEHEKSFFNSKIQTHLSDQILNEEEEASSLRNTKVDDGEVYNI